MVPACECILAVTPDAPHWTSGKAYKCARPPGVSGLTLDGVKNLGYSKHGQAAILELSLHAPAVARGRNKVSKISFLDCTIESNVGVFTCQSNAVLGPGDSRRGNAVTNMSSKKSLALQLPPGVLAWKARLKLG
jgi:hypothetical protein